MQKNGDELDKVILESNKEIEPCANYNHKLLAKIRKKSTTSDDNRIAGISLITAGVMMLFLQFANLQPNINDAEYQVYTSIALLKNTIDSNKFIEGVDFNGK
jgi:hypothetical protein